MFQRAGELYLVLQTNTSIMSGVSLLDKHPHIWGASHRSGAGLHTENEDGELIKPANQPLRNIQSSDLYLQCSDDCWTFKEKIIIKPLKGHSVFIKLKSVPHITGIMCPLWGRLFEIIYYIELFSQISLIWVLAQWVTIKIINGVTPNSSH